ncbi:phenylalanine--tRNA ligase alpha subunit [endosymbiont of Euscepes postfasciatus]|uniref:phenylalanine--tRNA ligase subunit alpha n=1 Tax=endosymbiont of Euscepes postfasciatus TaxID=650377 RepID=UPI000DC6FA35|nr:phenylalanine--tRNA ligase subunit alpha [endosymbiont of Euscepes postfasciatus]BBA84662.1 phenylalanine--tRNA ligase alpha subunit [endosymbiont of Euscepes postfasciatus]
MYKEIKIKLNDILNDIKKYNIKNFYNINDLNIFKSKLIGKKSYIYNIIKNFSNINEINKKDIGKLINIIKNKVNIIYKNNIKNIYLLKKKNNKKFLDITIPTYLNNVGSLNLISIIINKLKNKFLNLGFNIINGKEIEDSKHNFDLLNIHLEHPSRNYNDTFWINDNYLLRTQISSIQTRINNRNIPIKIISYGKVYRKDKGKKHSFMFHQMDGIYIDKNISISNLKFILVNIVKFILNDNDIKIKFRISYFPFTEPSIEMDIFFNDRWIEILGAGMIHNKILKYLNLNNNLYSGFAFGIGIERLIMIKYRIKNIKLLYENNINVLNNFKHKI